MNFQVTLRRILSMFVLVNMLVTCLFGIAILVVGRFTLSAKGMQYLTGIVAWVLGQLATFIATWSGNIKIISYAKEEDLVMLGKESIICNMNHRYELDFVISWVLATFYNTIKGGKVCLKEELRSVPILGKVWEKMGYIFLQRDWNKDKEQLKNECDVLNNYSMPYTVLIFCEGTRFTDAKAKSSNEFARKKGLKELKYHLTPRTKGFLYILESLRESLSSLVDVTVQFEGAKPSVLNLISGAEMTAHCGFRKYEISAIPNNEEECVKWLYKVYEEKDQLVEGFVENGRFPGNRKVLVPPPISMFLSLTTLVFITFPLVAAIVNFILILPPIGLYLGLFALILSSGLVFYKIWGYSKVNQGSNYGLSTPSKTNAAKVD